MARLLAIDENENNIRVMLDTALQDSDKKIEWVQDELELFEKLTLTEQVLLLLPNTSSYSIYSLCGEVTRKYPNTRVLLIFNYESELDSKNAIRAGAADVLFLSSSPSQIREDIKLAIEESEKMVVTLATNNLTKKNGRVITVGSTKGGVGKTCISVNLAASYGKKFARVAIIDLDLQFGDVSMFYDVKPKRTIYDWIKEDRDGAQIESFMTPYKDGISILSAPQRPEFSEVITGDDVRRAIKILKTKFDVIVIDTAPHLDENAIVALENSDDILLVTHLDLPTIKNTKLLIETLDSLKLTKKVKVVLNRQSKVKGLTTETVEKILGKKLFISIPSMEKVMITSVNEGKPVVYSYPRAQVSKKIFQIADQIVTPINPIGRKKKKTKRMLQVGGRA